MTADATALRERAYQARRDGNAEAARRLYEEAVAVLRDQDDPPALAHAIRHVGDLHRESGRIEDAERCYVEALAIYRAHERTAPLDLANAVRPFAMVKEAAGELEAARALWREARDLYAAAGIREGAAESAARLARLEDRIA